MSTHIHLYMQHGISGLVLLCIHRLRIMGMQFTGSDAENEHRIRHALLTSIASLRESHACRECCMRAYASMPAAAARHQSYTADFFLGRSSTAPQRKYHCLHIVEQVKTYFLAWVFALRNLQPELDEVGSIWFESLMDNLLQWASAMRFLESRTHYEWALQSYKKCFEVCS
jgi:hypothetical protein